MIDDATTCDTKWLQNHMPDATDGEKDNFAERVWICMFDGELPEDTARIEALALLRRDRKK